MTALPDIIEALRLNVIKSSRRGVGFSHRTAKAFYNFTPVFSGTRANGWTIERQDGRDLGHAKTLKEAAWLIAADDSINSTQGSIT